MESQSAIPTKRSFFGLRHIDPVLIAAILPLLGAGLITMKSFIGDTLFFERQIVWIGLALLLFFVFSLFDYRFLRKTGSVMTLYIVSVGLLLLLFILGSVFKGAQSWFDFGLFAFQPSDPIKIVVIIFLAKYFSRRHVEIANVRHIIVSGMYIGLIFLLVFLQPDFGSAVIIGLIWFGMVLVSGLSRKHLGILIMLGVLIGGGLWTFVFQDYQKERIVSFLNPMADIQGTGYNAFQSMVAVGSGELLGKGVGYGTQSRLKFLPEYETDFIFAAFAEEWGFVGVLLVLVLFGIVMWRILRIARQGSTNFEVFFGLGVALLFLSHFVIHIGMNIGLLPVTGTTIPFMSYGGSHLMTEFIALGILMGMRKYKKPLDYRGIDVTVDETISPAAGFWSMKKKQTPDVESSES